MLLKKPKIRAWLEVGKDSVKEDEELPVEIHVVNEGKLAAVNIGIVLKCPEGDKSAYVEELGPEGGAHVARLICRPTAPGRAALSAVVTYSDLKGRSYEPVYTASVEVVVHKRVPVLEGEAKADREEVRVGDSVDVAITARNKGDIVAICTDGYVKFELPPGGAVSIKRVFQIAKEGVNPVGPFEFACIDAKGREHRLYIPPTYVRGVVKKPPMLRLRATAPEVVSGARFELVVEVENIGEEEAAGVLVLPSSKLGYARPRSDRLEFAAAPGGRVVLKAEYLCTQPPRDEVDQLPPVTAVVGDHVFYSGAVVFKIAGARRRVVIEAPSEVRVPEGGEVGVAVRIRADRPVALKPADTALGYATVQPEPQKTEGGEVLLKIKGLRRGVDYVYLKAIVADDVEVEAPRLRVVVEREEVRISATLSAESPTAQPGGTVRLTALVTASRDTAAEVQLMHNGRLVERRSVELRRGENRFDLSASVQPGENIYYIALLMPDGRRIASNHVTVRGVEVARRAVLDIKIEAPPRVEMFRDVEAVVRVFNIGNDVAESVSVKVFSEGQLKLDPFIRDAAVEPQEELVVPVVAKAERPGRGKIVAIAVYRGQYYRKEAEVEVEYVPPKAELEVKTPASFYIGVPNTLIVVIRNHSHYPLRITRLRIRDKTAEVDRQLGPGEEWVNIYAVDIGPADRELEVVAKLADPTGRAAELTWREKIEARKARGVAAFVKPTVTRQNELTPLEVTLQNNYSVEVRDVEIRVRSPHAEVIKGERHKFATIGPGEKKIFTVWIRPTTSGTIDLVLDAAYTAGGREMAETVDISNAAEARGYIAPYEGTPQQALEEALELLSTLERVGPQKPLVNRLISVLNAVNIWRGELYFDLRQVEDWLNDEVKFHTAIAAIKQSVRLIRTSAL